MSALRARRVGWRAHRHWALVRTVSATAAAVHAAASASCFSISCLSAAGSGLRAIGEGGVAMRNWQGAGFGSVRTVCAGACGRAYPVGTCSICRPPMKCRCSASWQLTRWAAQPLARGSQGKHSMLARGLWCRGDRRKGYQWLRIRPQRAGHLTRARLGRQGGSGSLEVVASRPLIRENLSRCRRCVGVSGPFGSCSLGRSRLDEGLAVWRGGVP